MVFKEEKLDRTMKLQTLVTVVAERLLAGKARTMDESTMELKVF